MKLNKIIINDSLAGKESKVIDFLELERQAFIDPSLALPRQPIAISIGETIYKGEVYPTPMASYGDFSCIVGASKSRKTFVKSMIEAGYIGGQSNQFTHVKGHNSKDKFVLSFDTEQSKFHTQRVTRRVLEMVGYNHDLYKTYSLREYDPKTRFEFIQWAMFESEYRNNLGLVSVDGFVDLITDFNSLEQSTMLTDNLLKWTSKTQCHLTGILHKNFGSAKPVGHVGSSILKKAETVIFVETENNETIVKCEYSRNIPFDNFTIGVNSDWIPYVTSINGIEDLPNKGDNKNWF